MPSSSLDLVTSTNKPETHDDNRYEILVIFYTCKLQFRLEKKICFGFTIHSNIIQNPIPFCVQFKAGRGRLLATALY